MWPQQDAIIVHYNPKETGSENLAACPVTEFIRQQEIDSKIRVTIPSYFDIY